LINLQTHLFGRTIREIGLVLVPIISILDQNNAFRSAHHFVGADSWEGKRNRRFKSDGWRLDELWVPSEQNQFGEFASDD